MLLKSIEMKGFKSFPNKTVFSFPKGIISIVGPNGSGKSNILDAIRWVLGEKSAKNLRGEKMEDVIFSGTKIHKSMNFCEVEIVFDNSDHFLNIDYLEVAIKRKVYRNGENKYYINGNICRQKDIKELLLDSGIGKEGYSIISQGRIDEIVNSNPQERRKIFEEASGISKSRYQKEESEKKLEVVRNNLERINDIYSELSRQVEPLRKQKEIAEKYLELKEELKIYEINKILNDLETNTKEKTLLSEKLSDLNALLNECDNQENIKRSEIQKINEKIDEIKNLVEENREEKNKHYIQKNNLENEYKNNKEIIETSILQQKNLEEEIEKNSREKEKIKLEIKNTKEKIQNLSNEEIDLNRQYNQSENNLSEIKKEIFKIQNLIDVEKENYIYNTNRISYISEQEKTIENNRLQNIKSSEELTNKIEKSKKHIEEKTYLINKFEVQYDIYEKEIKEKTKLKDNLQEDIQILKIEQQKSLEEKNTLLFEYNKNKSQKDIFETMEKQYDGMSYSVKKLLVNSNISGIVDIVGKLISVEKEYEKAIESVLGNSIQNIVTIDSNAAKKAIAYLKDTKAGRATFLPLDAVKGEEIKLNGEIIASNVVKSENQYRGIINQLLGRTIIVDNIDDGILKSKKYNHKYRIVTKQGEIFNVGGSITGGSYQKNLNFLSKKRELIELNEKIKNIQEKLYKLEKAIEEKNKILNKKQKDYEELTSKLSSLDKEQYNLLSKISSNKIELTHENKIISEYYNIKNNSDINSENNKDKIEKLILEKQNLIRKKDECEENINKLQKDKEIKESKYNFENEAFTKIIIRLEQVRAALDNQNNILAQNQNTKIQLEDKNIVFERKIEELKNTAENLSQKIDEIKILINSLNASIEEKEIKVEDLQKRESDIKKDLFFINEEIKQIEEKKYSLTEEKYSVQNKMDKILSIEENYEKKISEEYEINFDEAIKLKQNNINPTASYINKIKSQIKSLGNVNIDSIKEYEKVKERYELFLVQKTDLELSLNELEKLTTSIERKMKKEFKNEFDKINEIFKVTFKELFGGGEGELVLTDENNILTCEIDINAQPPGKKLKNISVMSGGEKALTAIAILFAILMTRPTPFCFLDEIDAPLDDANIYRYNKYIGSLSDETQFITITHRRGTMEASDYIYGVTMEDKGISKIVSLKLDEAEKYLEN